MRLHYQLIIATGLFISSSTVEASSQSSLLEGFSPLSPLAAAANTTILHSSYYNAEEDTAEGVLQPGTISISPASDASTRASTVASASRKRKTSQSTAATSSGEDDAKQNDKRAMSARSSVSASSSAPASSSAAALMAAQPGANPAVALRVEIPLVAIDRNSQQNRYRNVAIDRERSEIIRKGDELNQQLAILDHQASELRSNLIANDKARVAVENKANNTELKYYKDIYELLKNEYLNLRSENIKEINDLRDSNEKLIREISEKGEKITHLQYDNKKLTLEISDKEVAQKRNDDLMSEINEHKENINKLKDELTSKINKLTSEINERDARIKKFAADVKLLVTRSQQLCLEKEELTRDVSEKDQELTSVKQDKESLTKKLTNSAAELKAAIMKERELNQQIEGLTRTIEILKSANQKVTDKLAIFANAFKAKQAVEAANAAANAAVAAAVEAAETAVVVANSIANNNS